MTLNWTLSYYFSRDPSSAVEFSDILYKDETFVSSLVHALTDLGVMVVQVGCAPYMSDDDSNLIHVAKAPTLAQFEHILESHGMVSMKSYQETHGQFLGPWEFRIVHKSYDTLKNYFYEPAMVNLQQAKSAMATRSKDFPFSYFDGATWASAQYPSRIDSRFYCFTHPRASKLCQELQGYDPNLPNVPGSALEVKPSLIPNGGRGLFFTQDFEEGSYLAIDQSVWHMEVLPDTVELLMYDMIQSPARRNFELWSAYLFGYGFSSNYYGWPSSHVDAGVATFLNHGCNGTYVVGRRTNVTELTADPLEIPPELMEIEEELAFFNPIVDRNHFVFQGKEVLLENVHAGQEVLGNYLEYYHEENYQAAIADIKAQCLQQGTGTIHKYESHH